MIVSISQKKGVRLKLDYSEILGTYKKLFTGTDFLDSEYMRNLMAFLFHSYRKTQSSNIYPVNKNMVFRPFIITPYESLKVVFVTEYPTNTTKGNGLGVGNMVSIVESSISPELYQFKTCIENTMWQGMNLRFDNTLETMARQGVLFLNSALTCSREDKTAHEKHWEPFIASMIDRIQMDSNGIVFAFVGEATKFKDLVDERYHSVIEEPLSINYCIQKKEYWITDLFNKIDDAVALYENSANPNKIKWL